METGIQRLALASTLAALFLLVWAINRGSRPLPCHSSSFIDSFYIQTDRNIEQVERCGLTTLFAPELSVSNAELARISQELKPLQSWVQAFGGFHPVRLRLVTSGEERVSAATIQITTANAIQPGQLLKAFLRVWFEQRIPLFRERASIEKELIVDFATSYAQQGLRVKSAFSFEEADFVPRLWMRDLYSWQAMCHSAWLPLGQLDHCQLQNAKEFSFWSLRPLVGRLMWQTYENLPILVKTRFFEAWLTKQILFKDQTTQADYLSRIFDFKGRAHAKAVFDTTVATAESLGLTGNERLNRFWKQSLTQVLRRAEYNSADSHLLVQTESTPFRVQDFTDLLALALGDSNRLLVVAHQYDHYILPSFEPVELVFDASNVFKRGVRETCSELSLKPALTQQTKRLMLVDRCAQVTPVRYQPLVVGGVESFAHHNPQTAFVELQPQALKFAQHLTHHTFERIAWKWREADRSVSSVEGLVGLFQPMWSEFGQAYQVRGAIEGIDWFRGPRPELFPTLN